MKPYRSMLFVPGQKPAWAQKAVAAGADAIVLDLEDSVPATDKDAARATVRATITELAAAGVRADVWVRPNSVESGLFGADVEAVLVPGLAGLLVPKVYTAQEVVRIDAVVCHVEQREGLADGSVGLIVTFETAQSVAQSEAIATAAPRVASLFGVTGPDADISREVGFEFTPEGLETLYLRSRIVLAARAGGLTHPVLGVWQDIRDVDGFRRFALDARRLGYRGMVCIHPSHVAVSNEVFTPSPQQVEHAQRLVAAFRTAESDGHGAVDFEGQMIDLAHVRTAEAVLALADAIDGR